MQIIKLRQQTKEWLEFRRNHICASDAPIIMGNNPYKKIHQLYDEKIKCYESVPNQYMKRGLELEPIALQAFEKETGLIMFPVVAVHDDLGWMAASFDGMTIEGDSIVEIKCPGKKTHDIAMNKMIPTQYYAQLQHQMHVAGLNFAYYYSFDGENGIILEVQRDQEVIEKMIEKELEFWNCLQTLTPPTIDLKTRKKKYAARAIPQTV